MAYCSGCGAYVGEYSMYRHKMPGKGEMVLCYRCKHWVDRHPGGGSFPPKYPPLAPEKKRIRTFSIIYIISSFGMFAAGAFIVLTGRRPEIGLVILLGAASLFLVGRGMRKFAARDNIKPDSRGSN